MVELISLLLCSSLPPDTFFLHPDEVFAQGKFHICVTEEGEFRAYLTTSEELSDKWLEYKGEGQYR